MTEFSLPLARRLASLAAVAALLGAGIALSACNTTAGAGQDVSAVGHAVTNAADKVQSNP